MCRDPRSRSARPPSLWRSPASPARTPSRRRRPSAATARSRRPGHACRPRSRRSAACPGTGPSGRGSCPTRRWDRRSHPSSGTRRASPAHPGIGKRSTGSIENEPGRALTMSPGAATAGAATNPSAATRTTQNTDVRRTRTHPQPTPLPRPKIVPESPGERQVRSADRAGAMPSMRSCEGAPPGNTDDVVDSGDERRRSRHG